MRTQQLFKGILYLAMAIVLFTIKFYTVLDEVVINGETRTVVEYLIFINNFNLFFVIGWQNIALGTITFGLSLVEFMGYAQSTRESKKAKLVKQTPQPVLAQRQPINVATQIKR